MTMFVKSSHFHKIPYSFFFLEHYFMDNPFIRLCFFFLLSFSFPIWQSLCCKAFSMLNRIQAHRVFLKDITEKSLFHLKHSGSHNITCRRVFSFSFFFATDTSNRILSHSVVRKVDMRHRCGVDLNQGVVDWIQFVNHKVKF